MNTSYISDFLANTSRDIALAYHFDRKSATVEYQKEHTARLETLSGKISGVVIAALGAMACMTGLSMIATAPVSALVVLAVGGSVLLAGHDIAVINDNSSAALHKTTDTVFKSFSFKWFYSSTESIIADVQFKNTYLLGSILRGQTEASQKIQAEREAFAKLTNAR